MPSLINITAFMLFWLLLVWSAFYGWDLAASTALVCWLLIHLRYSRCPKADVKLTLLALIIGPLSDSLLLHWDLAHFQGFQFHPAFPPIWVYAMWANFAQLLNHSMNAMQGRPLLLLLTGCSAAPAMYWLGDALGAAYLRAPIWQPLLFVSASWALLLPLLMRFSVPARR